jgi:hypothetical protein
MSLTFVICRGLGQSMLQVLLGRVVSELGSAGMTTLVSIIITGLTLLTAFKSLHEQFRVSDIFDRSRANA